MAAPYGQGPPPQYAYPPPQHGYPPPQYGYPAPQMQQQQQQTTVVVNNQSAGPTVVTVKQRFADNICLNLIITILFWPWIFIWICMCIFEK